MDDLEGVYFGAPDARCPDCGAKVEVRYYCREIVSVDPGCECLEERLPEAEAYDVSIGFREVDG